ncbi:MAG: hypothetical protein AAFZ65_10895, partial [Planctomycetota bacterium]
ELAIGYEGEMKVDEEQNIVVGAFSGASIGVEAKFPEIFLGIDNVNPSPLKHTSVQVARLDASKEQTLIVRVLGNTAVLLGEGQHEVISMGIGEYDASIPLLTGNTDGFSLQVLDLDGEVLFESDLYDAEATLNADYPEYAQTLPNTGALTFVETHTSNEEVLGGPIPLKYNSKCVPAVVHDEGSNHLTDCGACSMDTNPPEPNCISDVKRLFYTSAYCKFVFFTLDFCALDQNKTVTRTGPQYRFAGTETSTQGCTQASVGVSIGFILGGSVSVSKPRRKTCCKYVKCTMAGPDTREFRTCRTF